jgi:hypothetical protein
MYWGRLKPFFEKAIAEGDGSITLENTYAGLVNGTQYAVLSEYGACCFINCIGYDEKKVLLFGLCASHPNTFKFWIDDLANVAISMALWLKVDCLEIQGRAGWLRYLKQYKFISENGRLRRYEHKARQ